MEEEEERQPGKEEMKTETGQKVVKSNRKSHQEQYLDFAEALETCVIWGIQKRG